MLRYFRPLIALAMLFGSSFLYGHYTYQPAGLLAPSKNLYYIFKNGKQLRSQPVPLLYRSPIYYVEEGMAGNPDRINGEIRLGKTHFFSPRLIVQLRDLNGKLQIEILDPNIEGIEHRQIEVRRNSEVEVFFSGAEGHIVKVVYTNLFGNKDSSEHIATRLGDELYLSEFRSDLKKLAFSADLANCEIGLCLTGDLRVVQAWRNLSMILAELIDILRNSRSACAFGSHLRDLFLERPAPSSEATTIISLHTVISLIKKAVGAIVDENKFAVLDERPESMVDLKPYLLRLKEILRGLTTPSAPPPVDDDSSEEEWYQKL